MLIGAVTRMPARLGDLGPRLAPWRRLGLLGPFGLAAFQNLLQVPIVAQLILARFDDAAGDHQLDPLLHRNVEDVHVPVRHEQEEAGGWIGRRGNEDIDDLVAGAPLHFADGLARDETDRPGAPPRVLDQADLPEGVRLLGEDGLEDLLRAAVDAAHHRHAREQPFAHAHEGAPEQTCGEETGQSQNHHHGHHAETGNGKRQIGLRVPVGRYQRRDPAVDEIDQVPGDPDSEADRCRDKHPGQEIVAQPCRRPEPQVFRLG